MGSDPIFPPLFRSRAAPAVLHSCHVFDRTSPEPFEARALLPDRSESSFCTAGGAPLAEPAFSFALPGLLHGRSHLGPAGPGRGRGPHLASRAFSRRSRGRARPGGPRGGRSPGLASGAPGSLAVPSCARARDGGGDGPVGRSAPGAARSFSGLRRRSRADRVGGHRSRPDRPGCRRHDQHRGRHLRGTSLPPGSGGGLVLVAERVFRLAHSGAVVAAVLVAAALFAGAHTFQAPGSFTWPTFLFRTAAGVYLASVFATRGFGIAAGVHIAFNLAVKLTLTVP